MSTSRDFDVERARRQANAPSFKLGGETFHLRTAVRPETLIAYEQMNADVDGAQALQIIDALVLEFIADEDGAERWERIRQRTDDPIGLPDLQDLVEWMVSALTLRPTEQPEPSSSGPPREPTGTSSTDDSSSPAALVPTL